MRDDRLLAAVVGMMAILLCFDRSARSDADGGTASPAAEGPEAPAAHDARLRAALVAKPTPDLASWPGERSPEVKAYLTRIHRPIHRKWGFGVLVAWRKLPPTDPINNPTLSAVLELVLDGNGFVDRLAIAESSRYLPFDTSAVEAVLSAAPFIPPPQDMLSPDGRAYFRWRLSRDDRACGIDGVTYLKISGPSAATRRIPP